MSGKITKALAYGSKVRILLAENTDIVKKLCSGIDSTLTKEILAKSITITTLMSGLLKDMQRISLRMEFTNRKLKVSTDADWFGNVRGYISDELKKIPNNKTEKISMKDFIGTSGVIRIVKDIGMNRLITSITDMPYGTIDDDFFYFFKQSEQTSSYFWTYCDFDKSSNIDTATGILIQLLPGASETLLEQCKDAILNNQDILIKNKNKMFETLQQSSVFKDFHMMANTPVQFFCGCSKEIMLSMLLSLGREELVQAYESNIPIEFICNICGEKYVYNQNDILYLLNS